MPKTRAAAETEFVIRTPSPSFSQFRLPKNGPRGSICSHSFFSHTLGKFSEQKTHFFPPNLRRGSLISLTFFCRNNEFEYFSFPHPPLLDEEKKHLFVWGSEGEEGTSHIFPLFLLSAPSSSTNAHYHRVGMGFTIHNLFYQLLGCF